MKKPLSKLLKLVEWGIFLSLIVIFYIVASPLLPTKDYISTHVVSTGSMEPEIMTGSIVFSTLHTDDITDGDIIVFTSPENNELTLVHRIVASDNGEYTTKGDNNDNEDDWVVYEQEIKGKVVYTVPYVGYAIKFLKTPLGFGIGIGIPALLLLISFIKQIREGIHDEVEKKVNEKNTTQEHNKQILSALILLGSSLIFLSSTSSVHALFSSSVTIEGITITVGERLPSVIINEIMWSGTSLSPEDQWIELYNTTSEDINLAHWKIYNARDLNKPAIMLPANSVIKANSYFLISNYSNESKNCLLNIETDVSNSSMNLLPQNNGDLEIRDATGTIVDKALGNPNWPKGIQDTTFNSMQRYPGSIDGLVPASWYTCNTEDCKNPDYWKYVSDLDYGTPGSENSTVDE